MRRHIPIIGVTIGDPAGIGPEISVQAIDNLESNENLVLIGDEKAVEAALQSTQTDKGYRIIEPSELDSIPTIEEIPLINLGIIDNHSFGDIHGEYGLASMKYLEYALELVTNGGLDGVVGGPINGKAIDQSSSQFSGNSEVVLHYSNLEQYTIMLISNSLRVSHVTQEVPLNEVSDLVTKDRVLETIQCTDQELRQMGIEEPSLAVAGLNPHAGLGGIRGEEDTTEILPAIESAIDQKIDAIGPESPDTVFVDALDGKYDCVVAMYHDQGHIPVKTLGFQGGNINVSAVPVGLPFAYATVGHGSANNIAGKGIASPESIITSINIVNDKIN